MTHLQKFILYPFLRWVSANLYLYPLNSFQYPYTFSCHSVHNYYRLFGSVAQNALDDNNEGTSFYSNGEIRRRVSPTIKREAESALLDYLYCTRSLCYLDAEHMSKNSPHFVKKLVEKVGYEPDVRRSLARFLRYHPINEFEPFFESIGLEPFEIASLLPNDLLFLCEDDGLLDNYHVLCEYGFQRDKIGKIVREVRVVFRWNRGVLRAKLGAFEELGVDRDVVVKAISFNPYVLIGGTSKEFFEVVRRLKYFGYEYDWIEERLVESACYNWRQILQVLYILNDLGCKSEEIQKLIGRHPELLFDQSGRSTFSLIGFLLKVGCPKNDICSMFTQFPQVKVRKFVWNLRRVCELLFEIEMDVVTVGRIIRSHFKWLGSYSLKKAKTLRENLSTGNKNLCDIIVKNPLELKKWTLKAKIELSMTERSMIERWPESSEICTHREKVKFLLSIGFTEYSSRMDKAMEVFRGKGEELHERFNCLVKAGLSEDDASKLIKAAPQILSQSVDVLEAKISLLVNDLGYPVYSLKSFPGFMCYSMERVKLRCAMYKWLTDQKVVCPKMTLSTVIGCTESVFINKYARKHPRGPEVWQEFKQSFSTGKKKG